MTKAPTEKLDTVGLKHGQLIFSYSDAGDEFEYASSAAGRFLERDAPGILRELKSALNSHRESRQRGAIPWKTSRPIRTKPNEYAHQPDGKGGVSLRGELDFKWDIMSLWAKKDTAKHRTPSHFCIAGSASVSMTFAPIDVEHKTVALNFDVGASDSPGCFFHSQIPGKTLRRPQDTASPDDVFSYDVPRIPTFVYTPLDALDFMLGELFQEQWEAYTRDKSGKFSHLRACQQARLTRTLNWLVSSVSSCTAGSALCHVKRDKPSCDLLMVDAKKF